MFNTILLFCVKVGGELVFTVLYLPTDNLIAVIKNTNYDTIMCWIICNLRNVAMIIKKKKIITFYTAELSIWLKLPTR